MFKILFIYLFYFLAAPKGIWDPYSLMRDQTSLPTAVETQSLNHWTAREVPDVFVFFFLTGEELMKEMCGRTSFKLTPSFSPSS